MIDCIWQNKPGSKESMSMFDPGKKAYCEKETNKHGHSLCKSSDQK